jgi:hypothetical protein
MQAAGGTSCASIPGCTVNADGLCVRACATLVSQVACRALSACMWAGETCQQTCQEAYGTHEHACAEDPACAFDVVLEHTCMSGLHPSLRADYRRGIDLTLRPGGLLVGVWFIDPQLGPGEEGPPFAFPVAELTALFADGYEIVADYVPEVAFESRVGQERVRVLRRLQ